MGPVTLLALTLAVWILSEVAGKFIFKNIDKRVLSVASAAVINTVYGLLSPGTYSTLDLSACGVLEQLLANVAHDKLLTPLLLMKKADIKK